MKKKRIIGLIIILTLVAALRLYQSSRLVPFSFDQERDAWVIKKMIENKRPTLIGPEVAGRGFFLGPLYYYLLLPFYLVFNLDPGGIVYLPIFLSSLSILAFYIVGKACFSAEVGFLAAFIYSFSALMVGFDHVPWNVNLMMPLSLTIFYLAHKFFIQNKQNYLPLLFFCLGLYFHAHFTALCFLMGTVVLFFLKKQKIKNKLLIFKSMAGFLLPLSPLLIFDLRHNFINLTNLSKLLLFKKTDVLFNPVAQMLRILSFQIKNLSGILFCELPRTATVYLKILVSFYLFQLVFKGFCQPLKKVFSQQSFNARFLGLFYMLFFVAILGFYPGNMSEYYFLSVLPLTLMLLSQDIVYLLKGKKARNLAIVCGVIFVLFNVYVVFKMTNKNGLYQKRRVVEFIIEKAKGPFRLNYTTERNFDNGYRYLFDLYQAPIVEEEEYPAFTIVSPHNFDNIKSEHQFGMVGVIGPVYEN